MQISALDDLRQHHVYVFNFPQYEESSEILITGWTTQSSFSINACGAKIIQKSLNKHRPALVDIFKDESVAMGGFGIKLKPNNLNNVNGFEDYIILKPVFEPQKKNKLIELVNTWCIPKSPYLFKIPNDSNTVRVTGKTNKNYILSGSTHFYRMLMALNYFSNLPNEGFKDIIDWGCGSGRLTMHIANYFKNANVVGVDVDPVNIDWCNQNLNSFDALQIPWSTPTSLESKKYDLLFAFSVFSHISRKNIQIWLSEIYRIMKNNSYLIITTLGPISTASRKAGESFYKKLEENGYVEWVNKGQIDDQRPTEDHYLNIAMTYEFAKQQFSVYFDVLGLVKGLGPQDAWILHKK